MLRYLTLTAVLVVSHIILSFVVFNSWPSAFPMLRDSQLAMLGIWVGFGGRRTLARIPVALLVAPLCWACLLFHWNYGASKLIPLFMNLSWLARNILLNVLLPAVMTWLILAQRPPKVGDAPSRRGQQFGLRTVLACICMAALFLASVQALSSSVMLNDERGYVGSSSPYGALFLQAVVVATTSASLVLLTVSLLRNCLMSNGIPSLLLIALTTLIPWLLFSRGGISSHLADDYVGSVVLARIQWLLGWVLAYCTALLSIVAVRWLIPATPAMITVQPDACEMADARSTPDNKRLNAECSKQSCEMVCQLFAPG